VDATVAQVNLSSVAGVHTDIHAQIAARIESRRRTDSDPAGCEAMPYRAIN
jgi:hypothetical protein